MLPDFRLHHKATVIKTAWCWPQNRHRPAEKNRGPRNKPIHLWSVNLWQRWQEWRMGKHSTFSKWCWENWTAPCKTVVLEHFLIPYTKVNSKKIKWPKCKTWNHKAPKREHRQKHSLTCTVEIYFLCCVFSRKRNENKNKQMGLN